MVDAFAESKKHLALDTDWTSAVLAVCAFFVFGFLGVGMIWLTSRGTLPVPKVGLLTPLVAGLCIYFGVVLKARAVKAACFIVAIGPVSRMLLWLLGASPGTQLTNAMFIRGLDIALYVGVCVYIVYWFKTKIRYV